MFYDDSSFRSDRSEVNLLIPFEKFFEIEVEGVDSLFIQIDPKRLGPFHEKFFIFRLHVFPVSTNHSEAKLKEMFIETQTDDILKNCLDNHIRNGITKSPLLWKFNHRFFRT
jgi:hypothetical protein